MMLFALQVAEAIPAVVAPVSVWTPAMIGTVIGALATLITTLGGTAVLIIKEIRATKTVVESNASQGAAAGAVRDEKLGRIEVLVNGRYSEVLSELATVKHLLAQATGNPDDAASALVARIRSDDQATRLAAAAALPKTT